MGHPFHVNRLDPDDRRQVERLNVRVAVFYGWVTLCAVAIVVLSVVLDPHMDAMRHEGTAHVVRASRLVRASDALAAEPARATQCALRDLKLVVAIETHGEAQDVPAESLREAFFAMVRARAACAAGRIDEALAIYDGIVVVPSSGAKE